VRHSPLHRKIFIWFGMSILMTGIVVGAVFAVLAHFTDSSWQRDMARVQTFSGNLFAAVWDDPAERDEFARQVARDLEVRVRLVDANDRELAAFGPTCDRSSWKIPVKRQQETIGSVDLCMQRGAPNPIKFLLPIFVLGAILWGVSHKIARRIAYPLREVARVAREIGDGNLDARPRLHRHAAREVGMLASAIDDMTSRIKKQLDDQRVLLAAVSHEMRTPLGHLRILTELARDPSADREKLVDEIESEVKEIDELVGQLLAQARLEFSKVEAKPFDAVDAAKRALERRGIALDKLEHEAETISSSGDPTLVARALANVIDNAEKHGGGLAVLRVKKIGARTVFEVEDRGPGIPEDQPLFELFTAGTREHGNLGLGLALVRRIAEAHGGKAYAESLARGARVGFTI
jgi:two-component system, OmpR family, sensor kinase